jgi:hypothetical protein
MQHELAATYYSVKRNLAASLMLSDQGARSLDIQVTLFSSSGNRFTIPAVTLKAKEMRTFDIQPWVTLAGSDFHDGSLQVSYFGNDMELGGILRLVDQGHSLIFDEELSEPMMFRSSQLEGVWWLPSSKCTLSLALSNTTDSPVTALITVDTDGGRDDKPRTVVLAGHETRLLDMKDLQKKPNVISEIGGVSIQHSGPKGGLLARGLASDASTGYSNVIDFSDPQSAKSSRIDGTGLRVGNIGKQDLRQIVVARNLSDREITLNGRVSLTQVDNSTNTISLPAITLHQHDIRKIELNGVINRDAAKQSAAIGLEFDYPGVPGSVIMAAESVSKDENQVFRVPMIDGAAISSSTGEYPWTLDGTSSAFVYLKNATDDPQQYNLQIDFDGGIFSLGLKTIEPGQPVVFDLRALRDNQVLDANGRKIPPNATGGHVHWSIDGSEQVGIIGRVEQVDFAKGISMTAACSECCPDSWYGFWIDPDTAVGFAGDSGQFVAMQQNITCYGEILDPFQRFPNNFTSTDPSVASCDSTGFATALSPGITNIDASWTVLFWDYDPLGYGGCTRYNESANPESTCDVSDNAVTLTTAHVSGTTVNFDGPPFRAVLNLPAGQAFTENICDNYQDFTVTVAFNLPGDATAVSDSRSTARCIKGGPHKDCDYFITSNTLQNVDVSNTPKHGEMAILMNHKNTLGHNVAPSIAITIAGDYGTGTFSTSGTLTINCPY